MDYTADQWSIDNQRYLAACLDEIRAVLERYCGTAGNVDLEANGEANEHGFTSDAQFSVAGAPDDGSSPVASLQAIADAMAAPPAIQRLCEIFGLSDFERCVLLLCAGIELDPAIAGMVASLEGDGTRLLPSFGLALALFPNSYWSAVNPFGALRYWQLIEYLPGQLLTRSPIRMDEQILHYLRGVRHMDERLKGLFEGPVRGGVLLTSQQGQAGILAEAIQRAGDQPPVIQLEGEGFADQLAVAANASAALGMELYLLKEQAIPQQSAEIAELARRWNRECALNRSALLIECAEADAADRRNRQGLAFFLDSLKGVTLICQGGELSAQRRSRVVLHLVKPTKEEQLVVWQGMLGETLSGKMENALRELVAQFNLNAETIQSAGVLAAAQWRDRTTAAEKAGSRDESGMSADPDKEDLAFLNDSLWKSCCIHTRPRLESLAHRIEPVAGWKDIVLPATQEGQLRELAMQVRQRNKVYGVWGFSGAGSRGLGISALFAGDSGTGKTMASEVLANELKLDLYRIDLSQVVNKYIGETEKNLKRVFDAAEDSGAILLFDEAEALFGKRSEVRDSHDRYGNIEVSYLLQRMESYRGLAILTTNMRSTMDKAFLRRIRFIVQFPFPDAGLRAEIWRRVFPREMPREELDIDKLSRMNVPGGNIRNIALNAAFIAADQGRPVSMTHLARAARNEYNKLEKPVTTAEIGQW